MKNWLKLWCVLIIVAGLSTPVFAGGVDNKQNFSAAYAGSLSRNAATDGADAAAYNPAGLMYLQNGVYLDINAQPFTFDYDHTFNNDTQTATSVLVTPTVFGIYKTNKWALFGAFTINGGGGETEYDDGNIITQDIGSNAAKGAFTNAGYSQYEAATGTTRPNNSQLAPGGSLSDEYAYAKSFDYTFTTGVAYKINNIVSVAAGARYILTDKKVDIHGTYSQGGTDTYVVGKYDQEAHGFGGVFGLNIRPSDTVNIGIRYETKVKLDWDNTVGDESKGTVGENILWMNNRVNGESYARDLPAVLAIGLEWRALPKLTVTPSYTYYFEKDADWGNQNHNTDENSYDLAVGLQYDLNEKWSLTTGYMYIGIGIHPEDYGIIEKMSPPLDCHAFAMGVKYRMTRRLLLTLSGTGYFYQADTDYENSSTVVTYDKELYSGGIGIQYRF
ncbi:MAG TPA: long-chain fatty acid transport protein [Desulfobacteraceae bacterium]|nr:long-chain fatty acid transport protein [Desulfobacteraceae bacterium]